MAEQKSSRLTDTKKVGRTDRDPTDDLKDEEGSSKSTGDSWEPDDEGQGREGRSKGYGGSEGKGTGGSGPERK